MDRFVRDPIPLQFRRRSGSTLLRTRVKSADVELLGRLRPFSTDLPVHSVGAIRPRFPLVAIDPLVAPTNSTFSPDGSPSGGTPPIRLAGSAAAGGRTGIPFGVVVILIGAVVLLLWIPLRQRPGIGTVLNILVIGPSAELGLWLVPQQTVWWLQGLVFLGGLALLAVATGLYVGARLGPGPRDGLMTGIHARFGWPIWAVRTGIEVTVRTQTADAWTTDFANGAFQGSLRWTNTGATPYEMYQNIMDGAEIKPIGQTAAVNFGRYDNPAATAALAEYANAADDATRARSLAVLQKIMVEQVPMIPTSAGPIGAEYSTKNWVGWPSDEDPYGPPQATLPNALQIVMKLKPAA